ncbi:hypothetical protein [Streptomyces sp. enrichment culture]|uniref:hypothetical protein n=1 Tax=Streptomyces sp. enrichment culture TaxID=1795815 RepID=UPI003F55206D
MLHEPGGLLTELTPPGDGLTTGRAARRHVRDTARSWELPAEAVGDLEPVTTSVTVSVTDEGGEARPWCPWRRAWNRSTDEV